MIRKLILRVVLIILLPVVILLLEVLTNRPTHRPIMTLVLIWLVDSIFKTSFGLLVVGTTHDRFFLKLNIM